MRFIRASFSLANYVFSWKTEFAIDTVQCYPYPTTQPAFPQITGQEGRKSQFHEVTLLQQNTFTSGQSSTPGKSFPLVANAQFVKIEASPLRSTWQDIHFTHRKLISAAANKVFSSRQLTWINLTLTCT